MKYLFLFLPFISLSQNVDIKPVNGKYVIQLDTSQYFIKKDTSNGVINVSFVPTTSLVKDLESELGTVSGQLQVIQSDIDNLQERKKILIRRQKEITLLIGKVKFKLKK